MSGRPDAGMPRLLRVVTARPRLFVGLLAGIAAAFVMPADVGRITRAVVAWDIGVVVFLALSAWLFVTERTSQMPQDAARQEEGEWTIFALTILSLIHI